MEPSERIASLGFDSCIAKVDLRVEVFMKWINDYIDLKLLALIALISALGIVIIASATDMMQFGLTREVKLQAISFGIGLVVMILVMLIDYRILGDFYPVIYGVSVVFLLLVFIPGLGIKIAGATQWIKLGPIHFQTSEIAKLGAIIVMAKLFEKRYGKLDRFQDLFVPILWLIPILGILLIQPDLGTTLVIVFIFSGLALVNGLNLKIVIVTLLTGLLSLPIVYNVLKPHQQQRIDAFLNPNDPTLVGNYQVLMSKITIGSGQVTGNGLFQGGFSANNFLPVQETDFIFAVLVEELGFVGGVVLIGMYFMLISRLIQVAFSARDQMGSNIVIGVILMLSFQIIENIGMTMGLFPVTGLVLPFMSYGSSAMVINMTAIGLVMSVYMRRRRIGGGL